MNYCGIDLASKSSSLCIKSKKGIVKREIEVSTDTDGFISGLKGFRKLTIVLEVSPLAEWASYLLEEFGHKVIIIDARKAKAIIKTKKKTDRIDAQKLADMARTGWYTEIHRKSAEARLLRTKLQARRGLIESHKAQHSRIRGLLRSHGVRIGQVSTGQFPSKVRELTKQHVPGLVTIMDSLLSIWATIRKHLAIVTKEIRAQVKTDTLCQRLMTIPGVGFLTAITFIATIDNPARFKNGDQVAAYLGLVPSISQSGDDKKLGRITKEGDSLLRSYLVEGAVTVLYNPRVSSPMKTWGNKLKERKGHGKASVAVARKLSVLLYTLWMSGESYKEMSLV